MMPSSGLTILSPTPFFSQLQVISAGLLELHNLLSGYRPVRRAQRVRTNDSRKFFLPQ